MQTLVYENYNKFITATDTIRKMKADFVKMEEEMDLLTENMDKITCLSEKVSGSLQNRHQNVQKLASAHNTLKSLQFVFDLPEKLKSYLDQGDFSGAVKAYNRASPIIEKYKDHASFSDIHSECVVIISDLKDQLKETFKSRITSTNDLAQSVNLLMKLGERPETVSSQFLQCARLQLQRDLDELRKEVRVKAGEKVEREINRPSDAIPNLPMDILEFVDTASKGFVGDLSLVIGAFLGMFQGKSDATGDITSFTKSLVAEYFEICQRRFMQVNLKIIFEKFKVWQEDKRSKIG